MLLMRKLSTSVIDTSGVVRRFTSDIEQLNSVLSDRLTFVGVARKGIAVPSGFSFWEKRIFQTQGHFTIPTKLNSHAGDQAFLRSRSGSGEVSIGHDSFEVADRKGAEMGTVRDIKTKKPIKSWA